MESTSADSRNGFTKAVDVKFKTASAGETESKPRCPGVVEKTILIVIMVIAFLLLLIPAIFYHIPVETSVSEGKGRGRGGGGVGVGVGYRGGSANEIMFNWVHGLAKHWVHGMSL